MTYFVDHLNSNSLLHVLVQTMCEICRHCSIEGRSRNEAFAWVMSNGICCHLPSFFLSIIAEDLLLSGKLLFRNQQ